MIYALDHNHLWALGKIIVEWAAISRRRQGSEVRTGRLRVATNPCKVAKGFQFIDPGLLCAVRANEVKGQEHNANRRRQSALDI